MWGRPPNPIKKFFAASSSATLSHSPQMANGASARPQTLLCANPLSGMRNNEVRTVMLHGVPIVALVMDNAERLCLAQISNTLLKNFSYNEIHNRRVALGITCVQCTPVQLELLRRAGAMPVSSRRCGMITKREAERLCKSFLAETAPPKLPDSFSFDVYHHCAWGCRGAFNPSRYNSSRAKCIKCCYCGLFFSPNKFIFHSHRLPESKYVQPDAANFNSWRRHIKLSANPPDEVMFAWEDVKAMFNGGSRKRAMAASLTSVSKQQQQKRQQQQQQQQASRILMSEESGGSSPLSFTPTPVKRPRLSPASPPDITSGLLTSASSEAKTSPSSSSSSTGSSGGLSNSHLAGPPYPFPLIPLHGNKAYGALMQGLAPTPFPRSSLTHLSSSPRPPGPGPASPHGFRATPISPIFSESSQHDVRQSFAELMGTSLLLPYNYFQLSRYWPPRPPTTTAPSQILDMSSSRQRLAFGMTDNGLATAASLAEKVLAGGEGGHGWDREQESQRSGLSHGGSAFKPVSKNLCPGIVSSAKGSAFRAENLISNCTRSCSPADSARSEDEENEVDVIGGEEDGMRDRNGRRHRDSGSPLQNRAESSSHSESFERRNRKQCHRRLLPLLSLPSPTPALTPHAATPVPLFPDLYNK